ALYQKAAMVEEVPTADTDVEVTRADVAVVQLEEAALRAPPDEPAGEPEDDEVVEGEPGRRVDGDAGVRRRRGGVVCHVGGCYAGCGPQSRSCFPAVRSASVIQRSPFCRQFLWAVLDSNQRP